MHFLLDDPCLEYTPLDDANRNLANLDPNVDDSDCDGFLEKWYRFERDAGTRMPIECPRPPVRDRPFPVWLNVESNKLPYKEEGVKTDIEVCLPWHGPVCCRTDRHFKISVKNCSSYLVYKLREVPECPYRYYGIN